MHAVTATGVSVESRAGDIRAFSHLDLNLITVDGSVSTLLNFFEGRGEVWNLKKLTSVSRRPCLHETDGNIDCLPVNVYHVWATASILNQKVRFEYLILI